MASSNEARTAPTTSLRWNPDDEQEFIATLRQLQADGEIPTDIDRSEAMRRVLNGWAEDPDASYLE